MNPRQLVLFERSENDLFKLCTELSNVFPNLNYVPIMGDILDVALLREVFSPIGRTRYFMRPLTSTFP